MYDEINRKNSLNVSNYEGMVSNLRLEISALKNDLDRERNKIVDIKNSTFSEFQTKIESINCENTKAKKEINSIIDNLRVENQMLKKDYDFLTDRVKETENELTMQHNLNMNELNTKVTLMTADFECELNTMNQKNESLTMTVENYRSIVEKYETELDKTKQDKIRDMDSYKKFVKKDHEDETTRLNQMISGQSTSIIEYQEQLKTFEMDITRNSTNIIEELYKQNAKTVFDYETIVDELNIKVTSLNIDLRDSRIQKENMEDSLTEEYEQKIRGLNLEIDQLKKVNNTINIEINNKTKSMEEERGNMHQSFMQIQSRITETSKTIPQVTELQARVSNLWNDNNSLRSDNEKLFGVLKDCHNRLNMTDSIDNTLRRSLASTNIHNTNVHHTINTPRSHYNNLNVSIVQNESFKQSLMNNNPERIIK